MRKYKHTPIVMALLLSTSLFGCATMSRDKPLSVDQKIAGCSFVMFATTTFGALKGLRKEQKTNDSRALEKGALKGAKTGALLCGAWLAFENHADKQRLKAAQLKAANNGKPVKDSWTGKDGVVRTVSISPSAQRSMIPVSSGGSQRAEICRVMPITVSANGVEDSFEEIWCRSAQGEWGPRDNKMVIVQANYDDGVANAQRALNERGFDAGKPDGLFGNRTRSALIAYQRSASLDDNGVLDEATRQSLGL